MKSVFKHIGLVFILMILVLHSEVFANEVPADQSSNKSIRGGFYTSIHERVQNEPDDKALEMAAKNAGLSEKDVIAIAQGIDIDSLKDYEGIARVDILTGMGRDARDEYLIAKYALSQIEKYLESDISEEERQTLMNSRERLQSLVSLVEGSVPDATQQLLAHQERLLADFAFERSLAEFELGLDEQVKMIEIFADGELGDMYGSKDISFGTSAKEIVAALKTAPFTGVLAKLIGDISDVEVEALNGLPKFDLIRDLDVIDFILFGTGERIKLSPGGASEGFGFSSRSDLESASVSSDQPIGGSGSVGGGSGAPPSGGSQSGFSDGGDEDSTLPTSLNRRLLITDVYSSSATTKTVSQDSSRLGADGLMCKVGQDADLDYAPKERVELLEKGEAVTRLMNILSDTDFDPKDAEDVSDDEQIQTIVSGLSSMESLDDIGIDKDQVEEASKDNTFNEDDCYAVDFDIIFCYSFESGSYGTSKKFKDDSCINCHINEINNIFTDKLLPYSLKARKNEGLIGGGSYCNGANEPDMGMQILTIAKPLNFYKDVCYPDKEKETEPPIEDPAKKVKQVQIAYLKTILTIEEEIDALYKQRSAKLNERSNAVDNLRQSFTDEIVSIDLEIANRLDRIQLLRDRNVLVLEQFRVLKDSYESSTGCSYTIGARAADGFDSVLEKYNKDLLGTVPSAKVSEKVDSVIAGRLLSMDPESVADTYNTISSSALSKTERYNQEYEVRINSELLSDIVEKSRMLGKEVQEMTSHFRAIKEAMEALRVPKDKSVLDKLSKKETP